MSEYQRFSIPAPDTLSKIERIQFLKQELKTINQVIVRLNSCWTDTMPPLKEKTNGWLNEEIQFIKSGTSALTNPNIITANCDKIYTSLSVAKLTLLIRLLVVDKIIINRTSTPMLRLVTKVFSQKERISLNSLKTKFHVPDKATINPTRDMIFKWIDILDKL